MPPAAHDPAPPETAARATDPAQSNLSASETGTSDTHGGQSLAQVRALLDEVGAVPNKDLGQNFLVDRNLLRCVADVADIGPADHLLEVGPGTGSLTHELLARLGPTGTLLACEYDRALYRLLAEALSDDQRVTLVHADALRELERLLAALPTDGPVKLVANLPYQIATPLVVELAATCRFERLVFLVQREVGDRIRAKCGDDDYGPLSVVMQAFCQKCELVRNYPRQAFWPMPQVHSVLMRVWPLGEHDRTRRLGPQWRMLPIVVRHLFGYRRKTLGSTLRMLQQRDDLPQADWPEMLRQALQSCSIDLARRGETLTVDECIAATLAMTL